MSDDKQQLAQEATAFNNALYLAFQVPQYNQINFANTLRALRRATNALNGLRLGHAINEDPTRVHVNPREQTAVCSFGEVDDESPRTQQDGIRPAAAASARGCSRPVPRTVISPIHWSDVPRESRRVDTPPDVFPDVGSDDDAEQQRIDELALRSARRARRAIETARVRRFARTFNPADLAPFYWTDSDEE